MPPAKSPEINLRTPKDELNKDELNKLSSNYALGNLYDEFRDLSEDNVIEGTEKLAKSHGIYLEYNRAKTGREKDWMYMVRITVPGGGAFNRDQWRIIDQLANKYCVDPNGLPSIRLTTRQNIQYHWIKKKDLVSIVHDIAETGFFTLNGCGDNVRNVMGCPLSKFSDVHDAHALARQYGEYFRLPGEAHIKIFAVDPNHLRDPDQQFAYGPNLLNRKFKIAFSAAHRNPDTGVVEPDNCVELRTNDLGVAPVIEGDRVAAYQVYVGGGQGEKNGKPTFATLSQPLGICTRDNLMKTLDSVVKVHQEWGDRKNRNAARLKYVVYKQGIAWYQEQCRTLGAEFEAPNPDLYLGERCMHHGWTVQPSNGKWAYGAYLESGRISDRADHNGNLQTMCREVMEKYEGLEVLITPNQDALFTHIEEAAKEDFTADLEKHGFGKRNGKAYSTLRVLSGACVGLPTCRLSYTESEQFEPELLDQLDEMGYGDMRESIGITGCERQCFRPATKTLGWVGQGPNMYMLKLGGSEDGSHQGTALVHDDKLYLRQVKREDVAKVTAALFDFYKANRRDDEDMGAFHRRVGVEGILGFLAARDDIKHVLEKTAPPVFLPNGVMSMEPAAV